MLAINQIYHMDCLDFLAKVDDNSIDLLIADPPYNMDKAEWDSFDSHESFLNFSYQWLEKAIAKLKDNGSLYVFNTPFNIHNIFICKGGNREFRPGNINTLTLSQFTAGNDTAGDTF